MAALKTTRKPKSDEELRNILESAALAADPYLMLDDAANLRHMTSTAS